MAKTFNVEQLRLNGSLLTGNTGGELFYQGQKLANGETAVPLERLLVAGDGLKHADKVTDSLNLSANRTFHVMTDETSIDINAADKLYIPTGGVNISQLNVAIAGAGLAGGGGTNPLSVAGGSGISVASDAVNITPEGVTNAMLSGSISDAKLLNIVSPGKVEGSSVQLNGTTLADLGGNGLALNTNSVGTNHVQAAVAGSGLQGGHNGTVGSAIRVGAGDGLEVNSTSVSITALGVTNAMLEGSITDTKLSTISTAGKVEASALELNSNGLEDNGGLGIKNSGVVGTMIHPDAAGAGLGGGGVAGALIVNAGSGMKVAGDNVNIDESGVITSMLRDSNVTSAKLAGSIGWTKLGITAGDGLDVSTNDLFVDIASAGGLEFNGGGELKTDSTVVSALSSATQTLSGNYTFENTLLCASGLTINGDLQVQGQTLVTQQNQVNIGDDIIVLNADYPSNAPPDAGIEIERGTLTNSKLLFDDVAGSYGNDLVWKAGIGNDLYRIDTKEFTRVYGTELASGINQKKLAFGHTFGSVPKVVVSLEHTGQYGVSNPDLMAAMVTKIYTTGVWVDFSAPTNASGYYLNVHAAMV